MTGRHETLAREEVVVEIRDQCVDAGVPFVFKQWGGTRKAKAGRVLEGRVWDQMPRVGHPAEADRHLLRSSGESGGSEISGPFFRYIKR
jgi:hypothetical protein